MSRFQVSTEFEDKNVAIKATELLASTFPTLTFELNEIPTLDFDSIPSPDEWLKFVSEHEPSCSCKSFNEVIKDEFKHA